MARSQETFLNDFEKYIFANAVQNVEQQANKKIKDITTEKVSTLGLIYSLDGNKQDRFTYYSRWGHSADELIEKRTHQVGSTLKPLIYSLLVKQGLSFDDLVSTEQVELKLKSGSWKPAEGGKIKKSEVTIREALQRSLNNPLIRLVQQAGFEVIEGPLKQMIPKLQLPLAEFPAQMLGAIELNLVELLDAYYEFISEQCELNPEFYEKTLDILADPTLTTLKYSVNKRLRKFKFFGKTGTTNKSVDNLFVFFDGKLLGVIWVGIEGKRPEKSLHLGGSRTAFKVFQDFILTRGKRFNVLGCPEVETVSK